MRLSLNTFFYFIAFFTGVISGISQTPKPKLQLIINNNDSIQKSPTFLFNNYEEINNYLSKKTCQLHEDGFLTANYSVPKKINDSTFVAMLFKNTETNYVYIKNYSKLPETVQRYFSVQKNTKQVPILISKLKQNLQELNYKLSEEGNPFNTIQLKNIQRENDSLFADLDIRNLKKRTLDSIVIKGYPNFPVGFLKYYAGLKKGNIYNNQKIEEQSQQISGLTFVNTVKPAEVLFNPKNTQLYLYLKKQNANNFDGFLGFSTDEESGNLVLDGYLNLNLVNNLNFGEELRLTYKSDSNEQQQFSATAKLPYIFKLPLGIEAQLSIFRQEDQFSSTEQSIGLNYAFNPKIEALVGYKKYESADLNEDENIVSLNTNFDSSFLQTELRYTLRQNELLFPKKTSILLSSEIGSRSPNIQQYKLGLQIAHIFKLNLRNSIYIGNNAQYFVSDNFLSNELYRFGGILSIRGFEENSLRANIFNVLNTEYRYQLSNSIYAHTIIDFAFLDNQLLNTSDRLTSFGIGIGMLTKAGVFKLNYANGTSRDIPFEFGNSKIHLSLTAYF